MANAVRAGQPTNVRALVLALACGISFTLYLHRYAWGFVREDVRQEFGWDPLTLGGLDSLFVVTYAAGQVPAGVLADWFGARVLLGSSILLWSLALGGIALATGYAGMAASRLLFGAAQSGGYPVLNKVSKNWFPVATRTAAQGLIATFFGRAGGAASFFLFGSVLMGWLGMPWRWAVAVFTGVGLVGGVAFLALFRNTPREHPWANAAEAELVVAGDPAAGFATRSRPPWPALLGSVTLWFLLLRAFASNMADVLFVYWVPSYLREYRGLNTTAAGWMAALPLIGGALGGMASGVLQGAVIHATGSKRWARRGAGVVGKLAAAALMLVTLSIGDAVALACVFLAVKFFTDWEQPAEWGTITDIAGRNAATVFGCVNTAGALGGVVAGPLNGAVLKAFASPAAGWNALFALVAAEFLLAAACWPFIDPERPLEPMATGTPA